MGGFCTFVMVICTFWCAAIAAVPTVMFTPLLPSQYTVPVVPLGDTNVMAGAAENPHSSSAGSRMPMLPPTGTSPCV